MGVKAFLNFLIVPIFQKRLIHFNIPEESILASTHKKNSNGIVCLPNFRITFGYLIRQYMIGTLVLRSKYHKIHLDCEMVLEYQQVMVKHLACPMHQKIDYSHVLICTFRQNIINNRRIHKN